MPSHPRPSRLAGLAIVLLLAGCSQPEGAPGSTRQTLQALPPLPPTGDVGATAFTAFRAWLARPAAERDLGEGLALATARAEAMRGLLLSDPRTALSLALSPPERAQLPEDVARHVEQWRDGRGMLHVIGAVDETASPGFERFVTFDQDPTVLRAGVFGRREAQPTREHLRLHGVALDGLIALTDSPLRRLFPGEASTLPIENARCPVSKKNAEEGLAFHGGDSLFGFCVPTHADQLAQTLADAEDAAAQSEFG